MADMDTGIASCETLFGRRIPMKDGSEKYFSRQAIFNETQTERERSRSVTAAAASPSYSFSFSFGFHPLRVSPVTSSDTRQLLVAWQM